MVAYRRSRRNRKTTAEGARRLTRKRPLCLRSTTELPIDKQLASLTPEELDVVNTLKQKWESQPQPQVPHHFSDQMYLRFARCSPGPTKFNVKTAWEVMKRYDVRYSNLRVEVLEAQLLTKTLFIPPGLKTNGDHEIFYMKPSRYFPKKTPNSVIIDNLAYCMNVMVEKEKSCTEGIGFLANMANWRFVNFSVSYCLQFMTMLQGRIPVRVRLFLIVDPPSWFGLIWSIMKPMLTKDFQKKVHMMPSSDLSKFLAEGFEQYLPNELDGGMISSDEIVNDFITHRKFVESKSMKDLMADTVRGAEEERSDTYR